MKYGYYEGGALIKPINYFIAGAHILVVCSPTDYSSKMITLENVGWELRGVNITGGFAKETVQRNSSQ